MTRRTRVLAIAVLAVAASARHVPAVDPSENPATETITPMKEKDRSWKVSGYFIK